ncbi:hypothetical protein [Mesorhizobium sp. CAU 1732]|uniref:hypothetical protein n=1 Tax=Mesorhizobium sp. CAU 1732 TaxID=3140358 RepID=UPI00326122B9
MGLITMSERDLQRIEILSKVIFALTELPAGILSVLIGCEPVAACLGLRRGVAK